LKVRTALVDANAPRNFDIALVVRRQRGAEVPGLLRTQPAVPAL